jgi:hypothetical protein
MWALGTVDGLCQLPLFATGRTTGCARVSAVVVNQVGDGVDGIGEVLVEVPQLYYSKRLEKVLHQNVEVVALSGHQFWIAGGNGWVGRLVSILGGGGNEVADVGPGERRVVLPLGGVGVAELQAY